jgi:hypothetical protein
MTSTITLTIEFAKAFGMEADFCTTCTEIYPSCTCGCFLATAEIELSLGVKQMGSIAVGDKVHVGSIAVGDKVHKQYSDVYYFSTAMEDTMSKFVSLATLDTKKPLLLSLGNKLLILCFCLLWIVIISHIVTLAVPPLLLCISFCQTTILHHQLY